MNFFSIEFTLQLICFVIIYWLLKKKPIYQNVLLFAASYIFLIQGSIFFAAVLFGYTILIYFLAKYVNAYNNYKKRKKKKNVFFVKKIFFSHKGIVIFSFVLLSILPLMYFKYTEFFLREFQHILEFMNLPSNYHVNEILAPLGISYYTFNSITYLVSIYKKELKPQNALTTAIFISFFPTITAGPIFRAKELIPQIHKQKKGINEFASIFYLITIAIIKKWWIAGWLANTWVDPVFADPDNYNSVEIIVAVYAYAIEIFFDFSGYTNLVTAFALLIGYRLPINFNLPYYALSLKDFWQRWHMSLSTWIRDYIYIPLGGNRKGFIYTQLFLAIGMMTSGLWHGASVNFLIWGLLHTIGVIFLNIWQKVTNFKLSEKLPWLSRILTFHYVCLTWIFFRATDFNNANDILHGIFSSWKTPFTTGAIFTLIVMIVCFFNLKIICDTLDKLVKYSNKCSFKTNFVIYAIILTFVISVAPSGIPNFIYAQF